MYNHDTIKIDKTLKRLIYGEASFKINSNIVQLFLCSNLKMAQVFLPKKWLIFKCFQNNFCQYVDPKYNMFGLMFVKSLLNTVQEKHVRFFYKRQDLTLYTNWLCSSVVNNLNQIFMTVGGIFIGQANQGLALTHSERSVRTPSGG